MAYFDNKHSRVPMNPIALAKNCARVRGMCLVYSDRRRQPDAKRPFGQEVAATGRWHLRPKGTSRLGRQQGHSISSCSRVNILGSNMKMVSEELTFGFGW